MKYFRILSVLAALICCSFGYSKGNIDGVYYDTTGLKIVVCQQKIFVIDEERGDLLPIVCANYSWADKDFVKLKNKRFFKDIRKNTVVKQISSQIPDDSISVEFNLPDSEKFEFDVKVGCYSYWRRSSFTVFD